MGWWSPMIKYDWYFWDGLKHRSDLVIWAFSNSVWHWKPWRPHPCCRPDRAWRTWARSRECVRRKWTWNYHGVNVYLDVENPWFPRKIRYLQTVGFPHLCKSLQEANMVVVHESDASEFLEDRGLVSTEKSAWQIILNQLEWVKPEKEVSSLSNWNYLRWE